LRLNPGSAPALYGHGLALLALGKRADGQRDLDAAMRIDPKIADWFIHQGLRVS